MIGISRWKAVLGPQALSAVPSRSVGYLWLLSASASTLLLLNRWQALLPASDVRYYGPWTPTLASVGALIVLHLLVSLACLVTVRTIWPHIQRFPLLRMASLLAAMFLLLSPLRQPAAYWVPMLNRGVAQARLGRAGLWALSLLVLLGCIGAVLKWPRRVERFLGNTLLILTPLPLVLLLKILPTLGGVPSPLQITELPDGPAPFRQLYLLIFDEWDYGWTFAHRPEKLTLPNLDALVKVSFQAERAYPPTAETATSIPSLLTGILFKEATIDSKQNFLVKAMDSGEWVAQSDLNDLPREASRRNQRTLLLGCLHSYAAEYQHERPLLDLYRLPLFADWKFTADSHGSVFRSLGLFARLALMDVQGVRARVQSKYQRQALRDFESRLLAEIRSPQHDLVIAHLPVPHAPALEGGDPRFPGQLANLPILDAFVGRLRRQLELAGRWNRTTLIITSDHWQRDMTAISLPRRPPPFAAPDMRRRIPFVIWMPDHPRGERSDIAMNNRIVFNLVNGWLRGALLSPELVKSEAQRMPSEGYYDPAVN